MQINIDTTVSEIVNFESLLGTLMQRQMANNSMKKFKPE